MIDVRIRSDLEQTYDRVREAVRRKDYEAYSALVEPARPDSVFSKETFERCVCLLKDAYPDLKKLRFYKTEHQGEWAAYYATRDMGDPNYNCLIIFRFHRSGAMWRLCDHANISMLPKGSGTTRILKELRSNPHFRIPGQDGYSGD